MKIKILLKLFCFILISCIASVSYAKKVEVFTEAFPPFQTFKNNQLAGTSTDKVKALLQLAELEPEFNIVPWARAFNTVKKNENTLIYSMHRSAEREPYFYWLSVVGKINNGFVALTKRNIKIKTIDDAKAYVTAVARDSYPYDYLKSQGFSEDKNLLVISSRITQLDLLLSGKVDFLFLDLTFIRQRINNRNLSPLLVEHVLTSPDWAKDLYLAINKNSDIDLINRLKTAATEIDTRTASK